MFNVLKITDAGGKPDSADLLGLLIIQTEDGFFLVDPEEQDVMAPPRVMPAAIFNITPPPPVAEFNFHFKNLHWTVIVDFASKSNMNGKWINRKLKDDSKEQIAEEEDHWVATGTGTGDDVPEYNEARAASAK